MTFIYFAYKLFSHHFLLAPSSLGQQQVGGDDCRCSLTDVRSVSYICRKRRNTNVRNSRKYQRRITKKQKISSAAWYVQTNILLYFFPSMPSSRLSLPRLEWLAAPSKTRSTFWSHNCQLFRKLCCVCWELYPLYTKEGTTPAQNSNVPMRSKNKQIYVIDCTCKIISILIRILV